MSFALTVDNVLFTDREGALRVLMVRRKHEPFQGSWALPGGFVDEEEDLPAAAARELFEETGLRDLPGVTFEQLGAYGRPGRDPRGRTVSVAYVGLAAVEPQPQGADDAEEAAFLDAGDVVQGRVPVAFDHREIVSDALRRLRP